MDNRADLAICIPRRRRENNRQNLLINFSKVRMKLVMTGLRVVKVTTGSNKGSFEKVTRSKDTLTK